MVVRHMEICVQYFKNANFGIKIFRCTFLLSSSIVKSLVLLFHLPVVINYGSLEQIRSIDMVYLDHFWLNGHCVFHATDSFSRYAEAHPVESIPLSSIISIF